MSSGRGQRKEVFAGSKHVHSVTDACLRERQTPEELNALCPLQQQQHTQHSTSGPSGNRLHVAEESCDQAAGTEPMVTG